MNRYLAAIVAVSCAVWSLAATEPNVATRRWWSHIRVLANDEMQGRDTGSEGHRRAAQYVVSQFVRAGVTPAAETGYLQPVPLHGVRFQTDRSSALLKRANGETGPLRWLHEISLVPMTGVPGTVEAPLAFNGLGIADLDVKGKILVALMTPRFVPGVRGYAQRPPPGYAATMVIDSEAGPEPVRWPSFSSITMTLADRPLPAQPPDGPLSFQFNPKDAELLFEGSGHTYRELRSMADRGEPLPSFPLSVTLEARVSFENVELTSDNIIGALRGADPVLADEFVVVSAHLDGYGVGAPVNGDSIYNGVFDDAAYVATLIEFADRLKESGRRLRRSILFCVFTAEEKGLLGSRYFTLHPTVPKERMVANINLDMLRPIYPLKMLTTLALNDSTLGDVARRVAASMELQLRADPEPDRELLRRSDLWNFIQTGIPGLAFIFGYEPGSSEETTYRRWYAERYHSPADDLDQPWDPGGAARFNEFFFKLVEAVANDPTRPAVTRVP
jgi:Peptidase family M28